MYPRNAASPEPIAIGAVVQISDGAVQTAGVTVRIKPVGVSEADGGGTTAYSTDGVVLYTPTQGETNYTSFVLIAKKTGCIPASVTVVTTASATAGYAGVDWSKLTAATSTVNLSGTTISTSQAVASVSGAVGSVTAAVTVGTNNDKTGYSLTQAFPSNFAALDINSSGHVSRVTLVDTTTTNTDMRGTDNAALASAWTATRAGYLDGVLIAANYNQRTVLVTGSNHVAADIHELQPAVITDAAFAAGWLTAAGTAADYITELQAAIGTATNQTAILDRVSFALSALAGNCSTAQTATETYVLSIGGNTYTAAYSGLDGSGNRGTTTLTKA
ncbi:MAG: hypothetical protein ACK528_00265 [Alphaproteobacteria bacterium]